ncbi:MAG: GNAT family N-acetyltransferase [Phoenicibacter congonensis]|uniref:GNAT family N-acetyltransferase n=1 Tax=Phoenicibacter congonensis TaxID=1944646 RepID=A0AA43RIH0_9ACTN|nr:GNAT family N-acetyltransferase [Phoenicibacter congonensis]
MADEVLVRELEEKDFDAVVEITCKTWGYDDEFSDAAAKSCAELYFYHYLARQTYAKVATINDVPVGVIMARNCAQNGTNSRFVDKAEACLDALRNSPDGREAALQFETEVKIDGDLIKNCGFDYEGELVFFAINSDFRGKGIGRKLFEDALCYFKREKISNFFLYTDTSCNYKFYEHFGMKRSAEQELALEGESSEDMIYFIYEYRFE